MNAKTGLSILLLVVLAFAALLWGSNARAETGPGVPDSGTVAGIAIRTFYIAPITGTGTIYATSARETASNVMSAWHSADVVASVDISGTGAITITPQISADNVNWITMTYSYLGTPLSYVTTVTASTTSTTTASVTNTVTASGAPTIYESPYQIILDADGEGDYFTMAVVGYYLRFRMDYTTTDTLTPTVKLVARND